MLLLIGIFITVTKQTRTVYTKAWGPAQRATHDEAAMDTTPSKVGCVLCQVHRPQPLHYPVVGPLDNL